MSQELKGDRGSNVTRSRMRVWRDTGEVSWKEAWVVGELGA